MKRPPFLRRLLLPILVAGGLTLGPCLAAEPLLLQTTLGAVEGRTTASGRAQYWLGIPYAEPPVGSLRWRAPIAHAPWGTVFKADRYGSACVQTGGMYGPPAPNKPWGPANVETYGKTVGSEDCLTLNVWRPAAADGPLPVIVFVHGGANVAGYSADPIYDAENLAAGANAVVVTLNYRLGVLGWFAHKALADGDPLTASGNFGLLDIVEALRFVQQNAAAFGGDAANVTLMGQSAGAINVYSLMVSDLAAGLFHKAMPLSGLIGDAGKKHKVLAAADDYAALLVVRGGLAADLHAAKQYIAARDAAWLRDYLKSRTPDQLLQALHDERAPEDLGSYGDDLVVPIDPKAAFEAGKFHHMPAIVGMTRDEAKLFMRGVYRIGDAERFLLMLNSNPGIPPQTKLTDIVSVWMLPSVGPWLYNTYASAATALMRSAVKDSASKLSKHSDQVYVYRFDWDEAPEPWKALYGAGHAIDLPFVFGNFAGNFFSMCFTAGNQEGRVALSDLMIHSIGAFIRGGDPNGAGLSERWRPWGTVSRTREILLLNADESSISIGTD